MNRKTFLTSLAAFYLISGCGAAWLTMRQPDTAASESTVDTALVLPTPAPETSAPETEPETILETTEAIATEPETSEAAVSEPETIPAEESTEESKEAETEAPAYTYRAIHKKYRLFIRETADAASPSIGYLKPGETGDVISVDGDWVLLEHNGLTGYVSAQFLELTEKPET